MKKALLIGINYYNTPNELKGCIEDINNMKNALKTLYNFKDSDITVLTDSPHQTQDKIPNKNNVEKEMKKLFENAVSGDTLFLHYSGHGTQTRDTNGDETDLMDDAIMPQDFMKNGIITDDAIFSNMIQKVPKGVTLCAFFDCCHSGSLFDLEWNFKTIDTSSTKAGFKVWKENINSTNGTVFMYSGCYDEQSSADTFIANKNQGAFTFCLLDILAQHNKRLRNCELLKEVNSSLCAQGFTQRSQFSCSDIGLFDSNFTI